MHLKVFLRVFLSCTLIFTVSCNRERRLVEILDGVHRIEEMLKKEERLREITAIISIDSTLDKMSKKFDLLMGMLDNSPSLASPRSGGENALMPRELTSNLEVIDNRLSNLESAVAKVEESTSKIDLYAARIEEIESRTTQMKDDTNLKLRKMSNVINALYEMNKDMKVNMVGKPESQDQTPSGSSTSYATDYLVENLEEMERKMKEQLSVLTSDMRSEISSLKMVVSTLSGNCQSSSDDDLEDEWKTPMDNARSIPPRQSSRSSQRVENALDSLVENLGRQTQEIREEIHNGMLELDNKLNNLTAIAHSQQICDPMQASESVVDKQFVRASLPVQSVREKQSGRSESCTKNVQNVPNPKSCADLRKGGATCDGIYVIFPKGVRAVRVLCDMTTDGGGWTVIMRRGDYGDKMTTFHKNWASYKNGFGDSEGEFWLGNDVIHLMTTEENNMLRIHLSAFDNDEINLDYTSFGVGNDSSFYRLHLGLPTGAAANTPASNSLRYHNNHPFSTFDRKNDGFEQNCAATYKGGWWFNGCYFGFLTGEYFKASDKRETWQGILWYDWKGNQSLKGAEMMVRPKNF